MLGYVCLVLNELKKKITSSNFSQVYLFRFIKLKVKARYY